MRRATTSCCASDYSKDAVTEYAIAKHTACTQNKSDQFALENRYSCRSAKSCRTRTSNEAEPMISSHLTVADLYSEYQAPLRRYARGLAQDASLADDLVQETFIQALAHLDLLDGLNPYQRRGWLYQVLKNRYFDELRTRRRRQVMFERLAQAELMERTLAAAPQGYHLPADIPKNHRAVLVRHYLYGMTSEEIGRELGIPPATARSRLRLALNWLRKHM
jgi:RNA polymerase sigma-70 factor (ECF subfamily)